ncbi:MAG: SCO family protein [Flavobacteriales bacterium]|nr:MAG: SCO family protein [Flavobacteriales bacterium]
MFKVKKLNLLVFGATFAILVALFFFALKESEPKRVLPIINPSQINSVLVDQDLQRIGRGHRVTDFSLIDHLGQRVDSNIVSGKVRVVEFFFTTCPSICRIMNQELQKVQQAFSGDTRLMILSHTVMPEVDDVATLAQYAVDHDIDAVNWRLLTGEKDEIYRLARRSYFVAPDPDNDYPAIDGHDFIHTENIALIDPNGRIRGFYDGTDAEEMSQLIEDIAILFEDF